MRSVLFLLLAVVAAAAAVLSFAALRDLALACSYSPKLAWLLPASIDAGATSGTLAWIKREGTGRAGAFGRTLALVLYTLSVGGNALSHALSAYHIVPPWWLVVIVAGTAPAVLGAVIHLTALLAERPPLPPLELVDQVDDIPIYRAALRTSLYRLFSADGELLYVGITSGSVPARVGEHRRKKSWGEEVAESSVQDYPDRLEALAAERAAIETERPKYNIRPGSLTDHLTVLPLAPAGVELPSPGADRAAELIAAGVGRRKLARELEITEHEARLLLGGARNGAPE